MSELKALLPCPFCGSRAEWHADAYCIECTGCYFAWSRGHKDNCIRTWNIRTPDPSTQRLVFNPTIIDSARPGTCSGTDDCPCTGCNKPQHNLCDKHSEDEIDGCCNCLIEKMDDQLSAAQRLVEAAIHTSRTTHHFNPVVQINGEGVCVCTLCESVDCYQKANK